MSAESTIPCPNCGEPILPRAVVCTHCHAIVKDVGDNPQQTLVISAPANTLPFDEEPQLHRTGHFVPGSLVYISIERVNTPIARHIYEKPIILGRQDTGSLSGNQDVDLNPYSGRERGVSRMHAQLFTHNGTLYIEDLNSSNGTAVNGETLMPHTPMELRDGDEVMLGRMMVWVNFD